MASTHTARARQQFLQSYKAFTEIIKPINATPEMKASLEEPAIAVDPTSSQKSEQLPAFNAYSIDGDVTGPLVYVNYGRPSDYDDLERLGISVKGAIVIARYGASWRGIKPKVAAEHGAAGCLIYSDPRDDGYFEGDVFPFTLVVSDADGAGQVASFRISAETSRTALDPFWDGLGNISNTYDQYNRSNQTGAIYPPVAPPASGGHVIDIKSKVTCGTPTTCSSLTNTAGRPSPAATRRSATMNCGNSPIGRTS